MGLATVGPNEDLNDLCSAVEAGDMAAAQVALKAWAVRQPATADQMTVAEKMTVMRAFETTDRFLHIRRRRIEKQRKAASHTEDPE